MAIESVSDVRRANQSAFAAGGGGGQQVFVQSTRPIEPGPWTWWQTDVSGQVVDCIVNDGL